MYEKIKVEGILPSYELFKKAVESLPQLSYPTYLHGGKIEVTKTPYVSKMMFVNEESNKTGPKAILAGGINSQRQEWFKLSGAYPDGTPDEEVYRMVFKGEVPSIEVELLYGTVFEHFRDKEMKELLQAGYLLNYGHFKLLPFSDKSTFNFMMDSREVGHIGLWWSVADIVRKFDPKGEGKMEKWWEDLKEDFRSI